MKKSLHYFSVFLMSYLNCNRKEHKTPPWKVVEIWSAMLLLCYSQQKTSSYSVWCKKDLWQFAERLSQEIASYHCRLPHYGLQHYWLFQWIYCDFTPINKVNYIQTHNIRVNYSTLLFIYLFLIFYLFIY